MPLILPGNVASATAGAYTVANSCRFNKADSAYLSKTLVTPTNAKICTFSTWYKQGNPTQAAEMGDNALFSGYTDTNERHEFKLFNFMLRTFGKEGGSTNVSLGTSALYRDPSAWYHIVLAIDTSQSTDTNRMKLYVNGTQVTSFSASYPTYIPQDAIFEWCVADATFGIGRAYGGNYLDAYLAEVCFIDGQQLTPTSFGEFNEDSPTIWQPIDVSGLTFGNNGFYLDFEDSANLGNDANGGTDLGETNIAAADQATDTPTNNFCTLNPLSKDEMTFSEGNCKVVQASAGPRTDDNARGTMGVSSGKWYWEVKGSGGTVPVVAGICFDELEMGSDLSGSTGVYAIQNAGGTNAYKRENGTTAETSGFTNPVNDNIINVAFDADNAKLYIGINGTYENQAGSAGDPAAGSNETFSSIDTSFFWLPFIESRGPSEVAECNFGGCPSFAFSSGNADGNGYGNFEYAPPSGYYALCTKNLAEYG